MVRFSLILQRVGYQIGLALGSLLVEQVSVEHECMGKPGWPPRKLPRLNHEIRLQRFDAYRLIYVNGTVHNAAGLALETTILHIIVANLLQGLDRKLGANFTIVDNQTQLHWVVIGIAVGENKAIP